MDPMPYVWLGVIVVMAVIEGFTTQMVSIWFVFRSEERRVGKEC